MSQKRIVVLIDEAHRTQYGTFGMVLNTVLPMQQKLHLQELHY